MCISRSSSANLVSPSMGSLDDGNSNYQKDYADSSSDCESRISGPGDGCQSRGVDNGLIKKKVLWILWSCGFSDARVEAIDRVDYSGIMKQAKVQCFLTYSRAMGIKCGGDGGNNVKWGWYGGSKDEISGILSHGFCLPANAHGLVLSPVDNLVESFEASNADEDGVRRALLCRVLLGKVEVITPGSGQRFPSSDDHDSGVDNLVSPHKYIIWSSRINTHVLPEFVVSFKVSSPPQGSPRCLQPWSKPKSEWMPIASLIAVLSRFLPPDAVEMIAGSHSDFRRKKITRQEMIEKVRKIAGDKLLISILKSKGVNYKN